MATITKTIGTDTRDYATITLWEAALGGDSGGSGNDAVGVCYADSDFDEGVIIDDITPDSIQLTVEANERHDGTEGTGVVLKASTDRSIKHDSTKPSTIEWLELDLNGHSGQIQLYNATGAVKVANCIVHGHTWGSSMSLLNSRVGSSAGVNYLLNCIVYDGECTTTNTDPYGCNGIGLGSVSGRDSTAYNCTVHDIRRDNVTEGSGYARCIYCSDHADHTIKNCIATDPGGTATGIEKVCYNPASPSNADMDYNLASDDTAFGDNSLNSKASADQFVSTTPGSEDLHLKTGADAIDEGLDLGTTPTGVEIDIDGRDRDAEGDTWDIGADEYVAAAAYRQRIISIF